MQFVPATFDEVLAGRWLTMDVGDVDLDGDEDIVLGSFAMGWSNVSAELEARWRRGAVDIDSQKSTLLIGGDFAGDADPYIGATGIGRAKKARGRTPA